MKTVRTLLKKGFDGTFSVEFKAEDLFVREPEELSRQAMEMLRSVLAKT